MPTFYATEWGHSATTYADFLHAGLSTGCPRDREIDYVT